MANMIYTTYQTNSYKIIKSTFNTYELPHAPVIFSINFRIFKCFEIPTKPKISDKLCRFAEGGGGRLQFPPLILRFLLLLPKQTKLLGSYIVTSVVFTFD